MVNGIRKEDLVDLDIVDSVELASDGYVVYLTSTVFSTTNAGSLITINYPSDGEGLITGRDHLAQAGDRIRLVGTSGGLADGYFIINSIISETSFSVVGAIASSTGGAIFFMFQAGAKSVGFDLQNYTPIHVEHTNVQEAIQDLDRAIAFSSFGAKQIEVDFGTRPTNYKTFTIVDIDVGPGSKLFPTQAGNAPTGRHEDENEMDPIIFNAAPKTGSFILRATTIDGPVVGKYKVNYGIG
jgi:hypothetical protein